MKKILGRNPILKVIVGSRAHKLADKESDFDYRGVFVVPTSHLFEIGRDINMTSWIEGNADDTSWEIEKFLKMAVSSNPTVLETFLAPVASYFDDAHEYSYLGHELRELFPYVWSSVGVKDSFVNYGINQRKKFFDNKDNRASKYATAYLRVLYQAWQLLTTGVFSVDMSQTPIYAQLKRFRQGKYTYGEVIESCHEWEAKINEAFILNPNKEIDLKPVNEFLLKVRKIFL